MNRSFVVSRIVLSIRHHKYVFVRFSTEIKVSSPILNKSEIPPDKRQAKV
jgi:hypothetical protein